jgi:hypothetical protein
MDGHESDDDGTYLMKIKFRENDCLGLMCEEMYISLFYIGFVKYSFGIVFVDATD